MTKYSCNIFGIHLFLCNFFLPALLGKSEQNGILKLSIETGELISLSFEGKLDDNRATFIGSAQSFYIASLIHIPMLLLSQYFRWEKESIKRSSRFKSSATWAGQVWQKNFVFAFLFPRSMVVLMVFERQKRRYFRSELKVDVALSCPALVISMDCIVHGISQNTGVSTPCLLQ